MYPKNYKKVTKSSASVLLRLFVTASAVEEQDEAERRKQILYFEKLRLIASGRKHGILILTSLCLNPSSYQIP